MGVWENPPFSPFSSDPLSSCWKIAGFSLSSGRSAREGVGSSGTNTRPPCHLLPFSAPFPRHPCLEGGVLVSSNALDFFPCPLCDERGALEDAGPVTCLLWIYDGISALLWLHKWNRKPNKCRGERRQLSWKWPGGCNIIVNDNIKSEKLHFGGKKDRFVYCDILLPNKLLKALKVQKLHL